MGFPVRGSAFRILVLCTGNSARSQIAEALLAVRGAGRIEAASAGARPAPRVSSTALEVLREHRIAWEGHEPKGIAAFDGQRFDLVITVCDHARDACPYFAGARVQVHWGMPDPAEIEDPVERRRAFASTYDRLARRVDALLALPLEDLEDRDLARRAADLAAVD